MTQGGWYQQWFGEEYLQIYPHRDQGEARRAVALVLDHAPVAEGGRVLDVACGAGRHLKALHQRGLNAFGLDLSLPLLKRARAQGRQVVRGDMRVLPFASEAFRLVTNFFTSFGYFQDTEDDQRVLGEVRRVLRSGGFFAFDFLNAERVRSELRERDEHEVDGKRVVQFRSLIEAGHVVEKKIEIHDPADRVPRTFYERVRLYSIDELEAMLTRAGLHVNHAFGDYGGGPPSAAAPRAILIGRAQ